MNLAQIDTAHFMPVLAHEAICFYDVECAARAIVREWSERGCDDARYHYTISPVRNGVIVKMQRPGSRIVRCLGARE